MTAEELKEKIQFTSRPGQRMGTTVIVASLNIISEHFINDESYPKDNSGLRDAIKEDMREEIMRCIYGRQRKEICEAMDEFLSSCHPMHGDYERFHSARDRLMKAARYQPHSTDEKKINPP